MSPFRGERGLGSGVTTAGVVTGGCRPGPGACPGPAGPQRPLAAAGGAGLLASGSAAGCGLKDVALASCGGSEAWWPVQSPRARPRSLFCERGYGSAAARGWRAERGAPGPEHAGCRHVRLHGDGHGEVPTPRPTRLRVCTPARSRAAALLGGEVQRGAIGGSHEGADVGALPALLGRRAPHAGSHAAPLSGTRPPVRAQIGEDLQAALPAREPGPQSAARVSGRAQVILRATTVLAAGEWSVSPRRCVQVHLPPPRPHLTQKSSFGCN